jgi:LysR family transcriptional regulator, transcription activator of glutamate synthase operon
MWVDTDALRWFQQVADGVTVTEVSDLEAVTQSGVSRALARIEAEVGTPLLRRSGRVLRMTHAGAAFKRHVDALLHELDDGLAAVNQLVDPETGTVAVAFQLSLGTWLLPDLIASFRVVHPEVRFVLTQVRDELVSSVLGRERVDLQISAQRPRDPAVDWRPLLVEPLRVALPPSHRLATRERIRLEELSGELFVCLRPTSLLRELSDGLCEQAGFRPTVAFEGDDLPTVRGFVAAGLGVAIVPAPREGSPEAAADALCQVPIADAGAVREIGLAWSAEHQLLPAAELFRQHVIERATARLLPGIAEAG